jgi:translation initiation factor IF-1
VVVRNFKRSGGRRRRSNTDVERKEDFLYFDSGVVVECLPGTTFKVKVARKKLDVELPPIFIVCSLKAMMIKRRVMIIRGDVVTVEISPSDMYYGDSKEILKGQIIERKIVRINTVSQLN